MDMPTEQNLVARTPYSSCNAGITHFHVDPHGMATICKVARKDADSVDLIKYGLDGLAKLRGVSGRLLIRHGDCTGCTIQGSCGTCMPLTNLYHQANAPLKIFCQHGEEV